MTGTLIRVADVPPQPWRNGGGLTRELLAWPAGGDWRVRVSVADIAADGPFSSYPGVDRWFVVLDGAGVELTIDGRAHRLQRHDGPLHFAGAAATTCRLLDGPTRDLNLMLRDARGAMAPVVDGEPWEPHASRCALFAARAGHCRSETATQAVPAGALLWFERAPASLTFLPDEPGRVPGWWLAAATRPGAADAAAAAGRTGARR